MSAARSVEVAEPVSEADPVVDAEEDALEMLMGTPAPLQTLAKPDMAVPICGPQFLNRYSCTWVEFLQTA